MITLVDFIKVNVNKITSIKSGSYKHYSAITLLACNQACLVKSELVMLQSHKKDNSNKRLYFKNNENTFKIYLLKAN